MSKLLPKFCESARLSCLLLPSPLGALEGTPSLAEFCARTVCKGRAGHSDERPVGRSVHVSKFEDESSCFYSKNKYIFPVSKSAYSAESYEAKSLIV